MTRAPGNNVARLTKVTHRYGGVAALDDISLGLPSAAMVGVMGPDGVGKSTLLGLIAGVRKIQSGRVHVLGGEMAQFAHRRDVCTHIAYMPQGLGRNLYPTLSVRENAISLDACSANPRANARFASMSCCMRPGLTRSPIALRENYQVG